MEQIHEQVITSKSRNIIEQSKRIVLKEKSHPSRILYAGPSFESNGFVMYRLIELSRGNNFLEKVVFSHSDKSIHSKMIHLQNAVFHRLVDANKESFNREFKRSINDLASVSFYRGNDSGHIRTNIIFDERKSCFLKDYYTYWLLKSYFRK